MPDPVSTHRLYLNVGSGPDGPAGWENLDASVSLRLQRLPLLGQLLLPAHRRFAPHIRHVDVTKGLPYADGSVDGVYASHFLEHLPRDSTIQVLREIHRVLRSNGFLRVVLPDLAIRARAYLSAFDQGHEFAADEFMEESLLGVRTPHVTVPYLLRSLLGRSRHLWMWDEPGLTRAIRDAGFSGVRRCTFGDSADNRFSEVERFDRFQWNGLPELSVEARH